MQSKLNAVVCCNTNRTCTNNNQTYSVVNTISFENKHKQKHIQNNINSYTNIIETNIRKQIHHKK